MYLEAQTQLATKTGQARFHYASRDRFITLAQNFDFRLLFQCVNASHASCRPMRVQHKRRIDL